MKTSTVLFFASLVCSISFLSCSFMKKSSPAPLAAEASVAAHVAAHHPRNQHVHHDHPHLRGAVVNVLARTLFNELDTDHDGSLSKDEFVSGFHKLSQKHELHVPNSARLVEIYKHVDHNGNGKVSAAEFQHWVHESLHHHDFPGLTKLMGTLAFLHFDKDNSHYLTVSELVSGLRAVAEKHGLERPNADNIIDLIKDHNIVGDGRILVNDFHNFIRHVLDPNHRRPHQDHTHVDTRHHPHLSETIVQILANTFFNRLDANNDGKLSLTEWVDGIKELSRTYEVAVPADNVLKNWYISIDVDHTNNVSNKELADWISTTLNTNLHTDIQKILVNLAFSRFDTDRSGWLTHKELVVGIQQAAHKNNINIPHEQVILAVAHKHHVGHDGRIFANDFHRFVDVVLRHHHHNTGGNTSRAG